MEREENMWVENLGSLYFLSELGDKVVWGRRLEESEEIEGQLAKYMTLFSGFQWH